MTEPPDGIGSMEGAAIEAAIPHRAPFLLLDRIADLGPDWIEAEWTPPADAEWFRGHYPGNPIVPGVLLCEHAAQAAAVLASREARGSSGGAGSTGPDAGIPVLTRIYEARFRRMVRPGELVRTRVELTERVGPAWMVSARARVGDERVLDLRLALAAAGELARATGGKAG